MTPDQDRLTLAFRDAALEGRFRRTYTRDALPVARWAILLGTFLYSVVFAFNDLLMAGPVREVALTIRGVFLAVGLGVFAWSYRPGFQRHWEGAMATVLMLAGAGLMVPLALDPRPATGGAAFGFNGPVLVILGAYVLFRLRIVWATVAGWGIMAAFLAVALGVRTVPPGRLLATAIFFSAGNVIGMYAAYALERSARRLFVQGEALSAGRREVSRLLEVRSRFFENVSHDLRTPLALIVGPLAHVLESPALPAAVRDDLDLAQRHATRLHHLVDALLELARLDAGHLRLRPVRQDLSAFVRGLVASFASDAAERRIALTVAAPEACPAEFDGDRLDRAIVNLVSNALKFTPEGGHVVVTLTCADSVAVMTVADTGAGITPPTLAHVFDRFTRAPDAEGVEGTGLGLALARELARLHGGDLTLESTPGAGTTARLWVPLGAAMLESAKDLPDRALAEARAARVDPVEADALPEHDAPADLAPASESVASEGVALDAADLSSPAARPLVLVVDDSADVRAFVGRVLGASCVVEEAADGVEGLERARALVPDLIITDLMMPRLDGLGLARALRADPVLDHVPVVVLTARAGEESRLEGLRAGVDDYLAKPFSPAELRARVANLVARQARLKARFEARLEASTPAAPRPIEATPVAVTPADEAFVARAQAAVEAAIADEHFGVDALAEALYLSRRQLERKLRALTGASPADFVRLIRLSRAASLLAQRYGTVSEVAYACGFPNASYFARVFRDRYGVPPSAWTDEAAGRA